MGWNLVFSILLGNLSWMNKLCFFAGYFLSDMILPMNIWDACMTEEWEVIKTFASGFAELSEGG